MSTRRQLFLLIAVLIGGTGVVAVASTVTVFLMRREIVHLSQETPAQVRLAKLQRGVERISGSFSRISAASSSAELTQVEAELDQTMGEVQSIASELAGSAGSSGAESGAIKNMGQTGAQLRAMSNQRIEAGKRTAEANRNVTSEIEMVAAAATKLSAAMGQLQKQNQTALVSSRQTNLDANTAIQALLVERAKIEELRSGLQEVRLVDKRIRLGPLREKVDGVLDSMASQAIPGKALAAQVKSFVGAFAAGIDGDTGLLAARDATLAAPQDERAKSDFEERQKTLTAAIDDLSRKLATEIDPLELAVRKANTGMNQATEAMASVAPVSAASAEVNARGRSIQALAWQLLAAADAASIDRTVAEVGLQSDEVNRSLASMLTDLSRLDRPADKSAAEAARKSFSRVRELLIGPSGVASAVREGLDKQHQAEQLLAASIQSIGQVALAGSSRAREAEGAQEQAVARIQSLSLGTFFLVGIVALAALLAGSAVGRRVGRDILASEARQQKDATAMSRVVKRLSAGARTLRATSRGIADASELVTRNVETIVAKAGQMASGIRSIAASAAEVSEAGGGAASLVESAAAAVSGLHTATSEIGKVTETIRSIAFKTNLLALNAAIEAAHAGQHGAGFGVVAAEVKNLAQAAAELTGQIDSRITAMSNQVGKVTGAMAGVASIIARIRGMQDAIAAAVQEQNATAGQIAASIGETATGCRGDSSRGGIHAMAEQLSGLAQDLEALSKTV